MMFYYTNSYEHMKEQLEERRIAFERLRRADAVEKGRQGVQPTLVGGLGKALIRLGAWLQQPTIAGEQVSS